MRPSTVPDDARYATRLDVRLSAQLRQHGSSGKFSVDVLDLSTTGFRCKTAFKLERGQTLSLALPGFAPLEAQVAWADAYCYGCAFEHPLHIAVYDHIVRQHRKR